MYQQIDLANGKSVKMWTSGVPVEPAAINQLCNVAKLPIVYKHVAVMPDVHVGIGATVGSVIPTIKAIIPAAVGVDIGCGVIAQKTSLVAKDLPDSLSALRGQIERDVPHGGVGLKGGWSGEIPILVNVGWNFLSEDFKKIVEKYPVLEKTNNYVHLGTLGTGNHFIEICLDEKDSVWVMLHSGSRGVGNAIGRLFIELAKEDIRQAGIGLPDQDLAYLSEGTQHFDDYVEAVSWAQNYARTNREIMMEKVLVALRKFTKPFEKVEFAVNCHHNYVEKEVHYGEQVWLTRKGAVRARKDDLGIIPGSMGAKSYIVRGLGNENSFHSCSHGAGRTMSRGAAKKTITLQDHQAATAGVECRKDIGVIDESPAAYKDIDAVMEAQKSLVEVVHTLKQVVCVKG